MSNHISVKWGISQDDSRAIMFCKHCARQSTFEEKANYMHKDRKYIGTSLIEDITLCNVSVVW